MSNTRIKIGHQEQADKDIYLLHTGAILCGRFRYEGRFKKQFREVYRRIVDLAHGRPSDGVLDISMYQHWDAISIYNEYIAANWKKSVSAQRMLRFANETEVGLLLNPIKAEFKRAVGLRWKRQFQKSDPLDPNTPKMAWQIL
ncbi:MAG: hypothetical protein AB1711_02660 [Thermodesulfobacteriota bacterium]